ncbi:hypothetical protein Z948_189 [Sulfitobacter donghicola DSW-25 = KCTC 12864 = JCM 14565]|uniref:Uncharacterized protein n=1 Tax=Sulfitobacter donghicola DSW-25 = KCTC 12864 = JCM 14565 TaxID=1300350 RepID=A0A073IEI5_9RHOB|nr:hypothetical protein DSW25_04275 [Sulfitobacter donghicola DSW-25 = KCTC 12864 = JCM 14565]KIN66492.1 hypothetical protein Z948_189 [Sulfitobacter donghicola DSW-25 = KCTC 12864 = JCM 14565]
MPFTSLNLGMVGAIARLNVKDIYIFLFNSFISVGWAEKNFDTDH